MSHKPLTKKTIAKAFSDFDLIMAPSFTFEDNFDNPFGLTSALTCYYEAESPDIVEGRQRNRSQVDWYIMQKIGPQVWSFTGGPDPFIC